MQQNMSNKVKLLISAVLIGLIIFVIMLITGESPSFYVMGIFILPIPITVLYLKYSGTAAVSAVILSGILTAVIINPICAVCVVFMYGLIGMSIGFCIKNKLQFRKTILILMMASLCSIVVTELTYTTFIEKKQIVAIVTQKVELSKQMIKDAEKVYKETGLDTSIIKSTYDQVKDVSAHDILTLIPGVILILSLASGYINFYLTEIFLDKTGYKINGRRQFSKLYFPNYLGAALIAIICIGLTLNSRKIFFGQYIYKTGLIVIVFLLLIDALSITYYALIKKLKVARPVAAVILFLALSLSSTLSGVFMVIGISDFMLNIRRLDPIRNQNKFKWGPPSEK